MNSCIKLIKGKRKCFSCFPPFQRKVKRTKSRPGEDADL